KRPPTSSLTLHASIMGGHNAATTDTVVPQGPWLVHPAQRKEDLSRSRPRKSTPGIPPPYAWEGQASYVDPCGGHLGRRRVGRVSRLAPESRPRRLKGPAHLRVVSRLPSVRAVPHGFISHQGPGPRSAGTDPRLSMG